MKYRFGDFEVDTGRFILTRRGSPVRVEPKPLRLLAHLLERHPDAVSKQELIATLWPDTVVTEGSLIRAVREVRRALRERADDRGMIRTVRGRGYAIAVDIERVGEEAANAPGLKVDFVGRESALASLDEALGEALAGRGRIVLVRGEAGIGKSRLLAEFAVQVRERGVPIAVTWCPEDDSEPPFWPWTQFLHQLVRAERLSEASLEQVAPLLGGASVASGEGEGGRGREARYRAFEAVARLLADAATADGLVLVIDDLHGGDHDSLQLLQYAMRDLAVARVLLVLSERDPSGAKPAALVDALAQLARQPHFEELRLQGLAPGDVGTLAERLGAEADSGWIHDITERSGGNPFYARELLRAGRDGAAHGTAKPTEGAERARAPGVLPAALRDVLRARLFRLSPGCNQALAAASVIGHDFTAEVIANVLRETPAGVASALAEAVEEGLLQKTGDRFRFDHAIVREVLQTEQGVRVGELHERVVAALESAPGGAAPAELVRHLADAGDEIDPGRISDYALRAGRSAMQMLAFESAFAHFDRALAALARRDALAAGGAGGPAQPADSATRCDVLILRGHARLAAGHTMPSVRADFVEAAAIARALGDDDRLVRAALGFETIPASFPIVDPIVGPLIEEALALVAERADETAVRLTCRAGVELYYSQRRAEGEALAERGQVLANRLGRPDLQAVAIHSKVFVSMGSASPEARLALVRESIAHAESAEAVDLLAHARSAAFLFRLELGDADAVRELEPFEALIERHRLVRPRINLMRYRGALAFLAGDIDAAQAHFGEALASASQLSAGAQLVLCAAGSSLCQRMNGQHEMVIRMLEPLMGALPDNPAFRSALANAYASSGRLEDARRELHALLAEGVGAIPRDANWLPMLVSLVEVSHAVGDAARGAAIGVCLEACADRFVVAGEGSVCMGSVARYVAMAKEVAGERAAADSWYERADEANQRAGALVWVGRR